MSHANILSELITLWLRDPLKAVFDPILFGAYDAIYSLTSKIVVKVFILLETAIREPTCSASSFRPPQIQHKYITPFFKKKTVVQTI